MSVYLLPEEILIEILVKLPAKSLIRFTSVCKEWRSLIRSPSFISTHLSNTENQALVWQYDIIESREHYRLIPKRGPFDIDSASELEFTFQCETGVSSIVGSCDGLVCLSDEVYDRNSQCIVLWNPAIRNHVVLPQPLHLVVDPYDESHHVLLAFGVASNAYKVLRLVYTQNPNGHALILPPRAEVFCLGSWTWRELTRFDDVWGLVPQNPWYPIFFEGFMHWIGKNSGRNSIMRFHVGDEVFGEIMLPQELEQVLDRVPWLTSVRLYMMGEKLGACKYDDWDDIKLDVWMMKDYGVKESWTKLYMIDTVEINEVIGFWGSGEALLDVNNDELVTYNVETKQIKHVCNIGYRMPFYVGDYKESLALPGGYNGDSGKARSRGAACTIGSRKACGGVKIVR